MLALVGVAQRVGEERRQVANGSLFATASAALPLDQEALLLDLGDRSAPWRAHWATAR